ncbi:MAG TPA: tripartite tricarboxylate transporter substrate-binding protein [Xanthobacteraceae bacterium]|nr:tripartite tricarboxylate transporter substrate-binding protein [Xanthobacteraceae bacterium]
MFARWSAATVLATALAVAPAHADAVANFYKHRHVNLIVGSGPGGGYDIYARLLARHFGKFIPGHPPIIVQNMPGAGSLRAVNFLYNLAPKDGTTIGTFTRNMPLIGLLGRNANVQFDPRRLTWLGSASSFVNDAYILIVRKDAPVKSIDEARRADLPGLVLGATAEGGTGNDVPIILRDTIGLHVKQVVGYPDSASIFLAIERGEIHGRTVDLSTVKSVKPEWLNPDSDFRVLVQFARATRHPDFPDVPTARELAKNEAARALIELAELPYALSRPFAAPPQVPAARAKALQRAFLAMQNDPQYLEDAAKVSVDVSPIGADEVLRAIDRIAVAPSELLDYARKLLAETRGGG